MIKKRTILLPIATLLLVCALGVCYINWTQGRVVAESDSGNLKIRQIPMSPPGLNSGYTYRCEVWGNGLLCKATILRYVDFAARPGHCSISIVSPTRAIFHIDGYDIECIGYSLGDDTHSNSSWERLNR